MRIALFLLMLLVTGWQTHGQNHFCGQQELTRQLLEKYPAIRAAQQQQRDAWARYQQQPQHARRLTPATLPVVVHIIHDNGSENISPAQVQNALLHLNQAFANTHPYNPADGVNTQLQFCLARRDPNGNLTNGINRVQSPLTNIDVAQDQQLKNLISWNPLCYINIYVVRTISGGGISGYAYLPYAHGSIYDGIVIDYLHFGTTPADDATLVHEMGHYLGLHHTFYNGCTNNNCVTDGDMVCDTPPDNTTYANCGSPGSINSCNTDALSGFTSDQADITNSYLDYGNYGCRTLFTAGQAERMDWYVQNVRNSLLNCLSCLSPCPTPVTAVFSPSANNINVGAAVNFTNSSVNANTYKWYINDVLQSTAFNFSSSFGAAGTYVVKLSAKNNSPLCDTAITTDTIRVTCGAVADFTPLAASVSPGATVNFNNTSTGAAAYQWSVNGVNSSNTTHFSYLFANAGNYTVRLTAGNGLCTTVQQAYIVVEDTCARFTFHKIYSAAGDDVNTDMRTTPDGGNIFCGYSSSAGAGGYDGALVKTDAQGNIVWSKTFGGSGFDALYRVRTTPDGGYIAAGQTKSYGTNGDAWVIKTDAAGNLLWSRRFSENTSNGETARDIVATADGGYALAAGHDAAPGTANALIIKMDAAGNVVWSRLFDNGTTDEGMAVLADADTLLLIGQTRSSLSYHDGYVIKLNSTTGSVLWTKRYDIDGKNNFFGEAVKTGNNEYWINTPMLNSFSTPFEPRNAYIKIDGNGNLLAANRLLNGPGGMAGSGAIYPSNDGGIIGTYNEEANNPADIHLFKANGNAAVEWQKKYNLPGNQYNVAMRVAADCTYISTGHRGTANAYDFFMMKTDILGNTANCNTAATNIMLDVPPVIVNDFSWVVSRSLNLLPPLGIVPVTNNLPLQTITVCQGITCANPPIDTCNPRTYRKEYYDARKYGVPGGPVLPMPDGTVFAVGGSIDVAPFTNPTGYIMKTTDSGSVIWKKIYRIANESLILREIKPVADGGFIVAGDNANGSENNMVLMRIDANGNLLWSRQYIAQRVTRVRRLLIMPDGGFVLLGSYNYLIQVSNPVMLIRTDAAGNLLWSRNYVFGGASVVNDMADDGTSLYLAGSTAEIGSLRGLLMKLDAATGNITWTRSYAYGIGVGSPQFTQIAIANNTICLAANNFPISGYARLFRTNLSGDPLSVLQFNSSGLVPNTRFSMQQDGSYIWAAHTAGSDVASSPFCLFSFSATDVLQWQRRYSGLMRASISTFISRGAANRDIFVAGFISYFNPVTISDTLVTTSIVRLDALGHLNGCRYDTVTVQTTPGGSITLVPVTVNAVNELLGVSSPVVMIADTMLIKSTRCNSGNDCSSLRLIGRDTICSLPDTVVYRIVRNPGCTMPVQWRFVPETNNNYVYRKTDSTITIYYGEPGNHQLKVLLTTPCRSFADSISIFASNGEPPVSLGPDIELCANSTITLRAGPRYKTYRWQDGSIDSIYTAFLPGRYYVTVTDSCGARYSDTINITPAPPVPFELGADRLRCNDDTVHLTAPAGFTLYTWGPNYNISNTSGQTVVVTPATDTMYTVTAVLRPGCIVTDSVRVRLRSAPRINLGNDTSFCRGNSITLDAGPGFGSYTWQDGTNGQQYTANVAGAYSVTAVHASGCLVRDTLRVLNLYNLPALNLGPDTLLCQGNSITFDAGAGFLHYLWQDGSGNSSFTTAQTGSYWVQVTDANNCRNRDTVALLRIVSLPAGFAPKDTAICQAQPIILRVRGNYRRYLWSTGQVSPAVSISAPGAYWVEVTDANGCTARENVRVSPKACLRAIYFPSAFTPGVDGKNDIFRAIVYGVPQSFYLAVYNRWGQQVFETRDYTKGWNGSLGGVPQDSGGFTWLASWRFDGQETVSQKGTLLLIR